MDNIKQKKYAALIVEDNPNHRANLLAQIRDIIPEIEVIQESETAEIALKILEAYKPDIVFLDVQLPNLSGFEFLQILGNNIDFDIIFFTAFDEYAKKAFEFSAIDFISKNDSPERLRQAFERFLHHGKRPIEEIRALIANWIDLTLNGSPSILLRDSDGILNQPLSTIRYLEASDNYTIFYISDRRSPLIITKTLGTYNYLEQYHFVRCHNKYIVNLYHIIKYRTETLELVMTDKREIPVSRQRKAALKNKLQNFNH
jgi:two-component system LytT family response regulator